MITAPPELVAAYGIEPVQPWARVTFRDPSGRITTGTPIDGTLVHDRTVWPRTTLDLRVPTGLTPGDTVAPVSAYGGTVQLDMGAYVRGVLYATRVADLDVASVELHRPESVYEVHAVSREARVNEDRYSVPANVGTGVSCMQTIIAEVRAVLGAGWPVAAGAFGDRFPTAADEFVKAGDRWDLVDQLADAIGAEAWFDAVTGALFVQDAPRRNTPRLTLRTGTGGPGATLTGYDWTQQWAPNRVVVRTHLLDTDTYATGSWEDTDPTSVTRTSGPYGKHTRVVDLRDTKLAANAPTTANLNTRAATRARRERSPFRTLVLRAIPFPFLEAGDTVRAYLLDNTWYDLVTQRLEIPVTQLDAMVIECEDDDTTSSPI